MLLEEDLQVRQIVEKHDKGSCQGEEPYHGEDSYQGGHSCHLHGKVNVGEQEKVHALGSYHTQVFHQE